MTLLNKGENLSFNIKVVEISKSKLIWHKNLEIIYVISGTVKAVVENESYILNTEDIMLINSKKFHSIMPLIPKSKILRLQIDTEYYKKFYNGLDKLDIKCNSSLDDEKDKYEEIKNLISNLAWIISKEKEGYKLRAELKINSLILYLIENFEHTYSNDEVLDIDRDRIIKITDYIDNNFKRKITLEELAQEVNISTYYLSRYFRERVGISLQEYTNIVRLNNAQRMLLYTNENITDICYKSGFSSTSYFNKLFRKNYAHTPSEYRNRYFTESLSSMETLKDSGDFLKLNRAKSFKTMMKYLDLETIDRGEARIELNLNKNKILDEYKVWNKLANIGDISNFNNKFTRNLIIDFQEDIGFEYIRFKNIFSENIIRYDENNNYVWYKFDEIIDFLHMVDAKPYIEFNYILDLREFEAMNNKSNSYFNKWLEILESFMSHCIKRYGIEEIENWCFEVWDYDYYKDVIYEFELNVDIYYNRYKEIYYTIKSNSKNIRIGWPIISGYMGIKTLWLNYVKKDNITIDFISLHIYPGEEYIKKLFEPTSLDKGIGFDGSTIILLKRLRNQLENLNMEDIDLHITEYSSIDADKNSIYDTSYINPLIVDDIKSSIGLLNSIAYWDIVDDIRYKKIEDSHFFGGQGLVTVDGLKKSNYNLYKLLSKMGKEIIYLEDGYIVTRDNENYQILLYNPFYNQTLMENGIYTFINNSVDIYDVNIKFKLSLILHGLLGSYKITSYRLNKKSGSAFWNWFQISAPENMTKEEIDYINRISVPELKIVKTYIDKEYKLNFNIGFEDIKLITVERI